MIFQEQDNSEYKTDQLHFWVVKQGKRVKKKVKRRTRPQIYSDEFGLPPNGRHRNKLLNL